jgi:hypothetical protein
MICYILVLLVQSTIFLKRTAGHFDDCAISATGFAETALHCNEVQACGKDKPDFN